MKTQSTPDVTDGVETPNRRSPASGLLACPFCGNQPKYKRGQFFDKPLERFSVVCRCMMALQTNWMESKEAAAEIWNRRQANAEVSHTRREQP